MDLFEELVPKCTLLTPNIQELDAIMPDLDEAAAAAALLDRGCHALLVTGTHRDTSDVENRLYGPGPGARDYRWRRLPHSYHGSGCTLASAAAALIARGIEVPTAVQRAQAYTWASLRNAEAPGKGQRFPARGDSEALIHQGAEGALD